MLEEQANLLFDNLVGWENRVLKYIGARLKKTGKLSPADVKQLNNIAVVTGDMDAITKDLAKTTGKNISEIEKIFADVISQQHEGNRYLYDYRGKPFVPFKDNAELQSLVKAYSRTSAATMVNITSTKALGFATQEGFKPMRTAIFDALGKATLQVSTGAGDFNSAMKATIESLGGSGIRVNYGSGVTRSLESVVRQNLMWGVKQASIEYNDMVGEELGCDGIEIDWHSNPRPSHEFMQGKQYSLDGAKTVKGVKYEDASDALKALEDYGCLHFKTPIILGVSEPAYSPAELKRLNEQNERLITIGDKTMTGYEWKQAMRNLESEARRTKRDISIADGLGFRHQVEQKTKRLKAIRKKYNEIAEGSGIKAQPEKMRMYNGIGIAKDENGGIMKLAAEGKAPSTAKEILKDRQGVERQNARIKEVLGITKTDLSALENAEVLSPFIDNTEMLQKLHGERYNAIIADTALSGTAIIAQVNRFRELHVNPDYFNDKEMLLETLQQIEKKHIIPKGCANIEYVSKHEYAHLITMSEIDGDKSFVRVLYERNKENKLISKNARLSPYEFAADYLFHGKGDKIALALKKHFNLGG